MIRASVKEILLFKAFMVLAIHTDIFNVISVDLNIDQFNNNMYQHIYQIKAYDNRNTMVKTPRKILPK